MKERLPNSFSISELVADVVWSKMVDQASTDIDGLSDAVNDLWFLSLCDYLLYSPSLFPIFAILNSKSLPPLIPR